MLTKKISPVANYDIQDSNLEKNVKEILKDSDKQNERYRDKSQNEIVMINFILLAKYQIDCFRIKEMQLEMSNQRKELRLQKELLEQILASLQDRPMTTGLTWKRQLSTV